MAAHQLQLNGQDEEQKPTRRRINWQDPNDVRALVIASMGFSNACVQHYSGLSNGQIYYRLKLANMRANRREFRDGKGAIAKMFIKQNADKVETRIQKSLHKPHQTDPTKIA